jgi:NAD(P)-dependent dehydrogenase (short-subunit alcohol dehydrogenase family)
MSPPSHFDYRTTSEEAAALYAPHIRDKVILITGASPGGLAAYFSNLVAKYEPKLLILAGRSIPKLEETKRTIHSSFPDTNIRLLQIDLNSLKKVRAAAEEVNGYDEAIDVLINSAATLSAGRDITVDGFEYQLATNYIGPFLFTNLIMDKILASKSPRIVNVASNGHRFGQFKFDDWNFKVSHLLFFLSIQFRLIGFTQHVDKYEKFKAYGQSKTADMLFTVSLAQKLGKHGLVALSLHPGGVQTNLYEGLQDDDWKEIRELCCYHCNLVTLTYAFDR